jgi:hypothetical protein
MTWIDMKFKELEEVPRTQEESSRRAAREANDRQTLASKAWDNLAKAIRADIDQYNAHPSAKRRAGIRVMQHPKLIEVFWNGETRVLLHISPKPDEPVFSYSAISLKPNGAQQYNGEIAPTSENEFRFQSNHIDAAKLSEELLSPVLFP